MWIPKWGWSRLLYPDDRLDWWSGLSQMSKQQRGGVGSYQQALAVTGLTHETWCWWRFLHETNASWDLASKWATFSIIALSISLCHQQTIWVTHSIALGGETALLRAGGRRIQGHWWETGNMGISLSQHMPDFRQTVDVLQGCFSFCFVWSSWHVMTMGTGTFAIFYLSVLKACSYSVSLSFFLDNKARLLPLATGYRSSQLWGLRGRSQRAQPMRVPHWGNKKEGWWERAWVFALSCSLTCLKKKKRKEKLRRLVSVSALVSISMSWHIYRVCRYATRDQTSDLEIYSFENYCVHRQLSLHTVFM